MKMIPREQQFALSFLTLRLERTIEELEQMIPGMQREIAKEIDEQSAVWRGVAAIRDAIAELSGLYEAVGGDPMSIERDLADPDGYLFCNDDDGA